MEVAAAYNSFLRNKREFKKVWHFFLGFLLYDLGSIMFILTSNQVFRLPQLIGLVFVFLSISNFLKGKITNNYLRVTFTLFFIWNIITILRLKAFNIEELRLFLFLQIHFFSYLVPLIVFMPFTSSFLPALSKYAKYSIIILCLVYIMFGFFLFANANITDFIINNSILPVAGFMLLCYKFHPKRQWFFLAAVLFCLFACISFARRTGIVEAFLFLVSFFVLNVLINKRVSIQKKTIQILLILVTSLMLYINFDYKKYRLFDALSERIDADSRTYVITYFFTDMQSTDSWALGKGIDGTYYNPILYWDINFEDAREVKDRENIENGFLYIILKQGIVGLVLFLLVLIPAIFKGLFSKNYFRLCCGIYCFIYFITMFSFGQPAFNFSYILLWICIGYIYSRQNLVITK